MSATDQPLVRAQGIPAPQYFNPKTNQFEAINGRNGANSFIEKGRVIKDSFDGSSTTTKTYATEMFGFAIVNDGEADLSFTINALTIKVKPNEAFDELFEPFTAVTVTATDSFRAVVRE